MNTKCPKCGYVRQEKDAALPAAECPACGVNVEKFVAIWGQAKTQVPPATATPAPTAAATVLPPARKTSLRQVALVTLAIVVGLILLAFVQRAQVREEREEKEAAARRVRADQERLASDYNSHRGQALIDARAAFDNHDYRRTKELLSHWADVSSQIGVRDTELISLLAKADLAEEKQQWAETGYGCANATSSQKRELFGIDSATLRWRCGDPIRINRTSSASTTHEQWVYREGGPYVYLDNDVVTTIQN